MKRLLLSTAAIAALSIAMGSANAADLGRPVAAPPVKAPAYLPPAVMTWAGFYAGLNLGWGWGSGSGTLSAPGFGSTPISGDGNGILGGGQIGYNWQWGALLFGLETDFQGTGADGTITGPGFPAASFSTPWFGTVRGRLGYAADNWLFYVTGGGAYVRNELSGILPAALGGGAYSDSAIGWTWTVGGGIEAMLFPKWSVKVEYLFIDTPSDVPVPPGMTVSGHTSNNVVRVGVNYHF